MTPERIRAHWGAIQRAALTRDPTGSRYREMLARETGKPSEIARMLRLLGGYPKRSATALSACIRAGTGTDTIAELTAWMEARRAE